MAPHIEQRIGSGTVRITTPKGFATGFLVSPRELLTAWHVVRDCPVEQLRITGVAWSGAREPSNVVPHPDEAVDVALLQLSEVNAAPARNVPPVPEPDLSILNVGDDVGILGFSTPDRDLEADNATVIGIDGIAGVRILNRAVPEGFSGGPVVIDDRIAGLVYSRRSDDSRSYFVGSELLGAFLKVSSSGGIQWDDAAPSPLRRFPLGPMVRPDIVIARLRKIIRIYVQLYQGPAAIEAIAEANDARTECGPDTGERGTVNTAALSSPYFAPALFWQEAFMEAGKKSPRMLAALLSVIDDDALGESENRVRRKFLEDLQNWRGA